MALSRRLRRFGANSGSQESDPEEPSAAGSEVLPAAPAQGEPRRAGAGPTGPARVARAVFLVFLLAYVALNRGHFQSSDEITVYQTAQSVWEKGDLSVSPRLPNAKTGTGGKSYGVYSVGQSIAALPLYGLGKTVDGGLSALGLAGVKGALAGPKIEIAPDYRWGGEVTIFFVGLFNAVVTALLCALFFAFNLRLGVSPRWAIAATLLLGAASYPAVQATTFFQHSAEALFPLLAAYFLYADSRSPSFRSRMAAGICAGLLLLFRFQGAVALPVLFLYLIWTSWRRGARARTVLRESIPFAVPLVAAVAVHVLVNAIKFGHWSMTGAYGEQVSWFHNPLLRGLYGLLLSPGEGLFWFCPLLILLPWTMRSFFRSHAAEAALVGGLSLSYLFMIAKYDLWHGQWCFGPRYLTPIIPLLLLPLGGWMESLGKRCWRIVGPLSAAGAFVVLLGIAVNFSYVYYDEGYFREQPRYPFLFIPRRSQLLSHARALFSMDRRVDLWLLNVWRGSGFGAFLLASLPLGVLMFLAIRELRRALAECPSDASEAGSARLLPGSRLLGAAAAAVAVVCLAGAVFFRPAPGADADRLMKDGMTALYDRHAPEEAEADFRRVLSAIPNHYGATFQLARALDAAGKPDEARLLWIRMFSMAANDPPTLAIVKERLSQPDRGSSPETLMKSGMDLLYVAHDPRRAADAFEKVLAANPEHYGANYQIAVALDQIGQPARAREYWEKVLRMAEGYRDAATLATAKARLAR